MKEKEKNNEKKGISPITRSEAHEFIAAEDVHPFYNDTEPYIMPRRFDKFLGERNHPAK